MSGDHDHLAEDVGMTPEEFGETTGLDTGLDDGRRDHVERDLALTDAQYDDATRDPGAGGTPPPAPGVD